MTLAIISQFYDKFLSLKNEPRINQTTFFLRILTVFFPLYIASFLFWGFMLYDLSPVIYFWLTVVTTQPLAFIQIIKRSHDSILNFILIYFCFLHQVSISFIGIWMIYTTSGDSFADALFLWIIYPISQLIIYSIVTIIPSEKKSNKYGPYKKSNKWVILWIVTSFISIGIGMWIYLYLTNL